MVLLQAGAAQIEIDLTAGARLASWQLGDLELLVTRGDVRGSTFHWGCYPMAPWVGRVPHGHFHFAGKQHQLPLNMPPHAIHGTTYDREWEASGNGTGFRIDLGEAWPFPGEARLNYQLEVDALHITLEVFSSHEIFPAACGMHPWFLKQLARGAPARLAFQAEAMYARDKDSPVGSTLVPPPAGPWDHCFKGVSQPVALTWPGALQLTIESDASHWIVYNELPHALCVEPLTGPPDGINMEPRPVAPGNPLQLNACFRWKLL